MSRSHRPNTLFIEWLRGHLDKRSFPGCVWVDKKRAEFKIFWPKAYKNVSMSDIAVMLAWQNHKFGDTKTFNEPTVVKGNFRSVMYSKKGGKSGGIQPLNRHYSCEEEKLWKYYQFVDTPSHVDHNVPHLKRDLESSVGECPGTEKYEPEELYPETHIDGEYNDVIDGTFNWRLHIRVFKKDRTLIQEYLYDYVNEDHGKRKLHFFISGNESRIRHMESIYRSLLPNINIEEIVSVPIDSNKNEFFSARFPCPTREDPNKTTTMRELFCPGFILEVDDNFNVYITRISQKRIHYGHQGSTDTWVQLLSPKQGVGGQRQMIFSYRKFVHRHYVYSQYLDDNTVGKAEIEMIHPVVIMPVSDKPPLGQSYTQGQFFFEIEHLPAAKLYEGVLQKQCSVPAGPSISEDVVDKLLDSVNDLNLNQSPAVSYIPHHNNTNAGYHGDAAVMAHQYDNHAMFHPQYSCVNSPPMEVINGVKDEMGEYQSNYSPMISPISPHSVYSLEGSVVEEAFVAQQAQLSKEGLHAGNLPGNFMYRNLNEASIPPDSPYSPWSDASTIVPDEGNL